jgi:2-methylcitrate dehydratase PrpD
MDNSPTPVTDAIVEFTRTASLDGLPTPSLAQGRTALIDTLAVAVAGAATEAAGAVRRAVQAVGGLEGPATLVGTAQRANALDAALMNGFAAHALDFDDTVQGLVTHPSCHLVPALLTAAEILAPEATTNDLILAHAVGTEVEARLSRTLNPGHGKRGWHATGTFGTLATAVAVCRLIDASPAVVRSALAIAASSASGLRGNFGTPVKPLHAGHAARNGFESALLAAHGIDGAPDAIEHRFGYLRIYSGPGFELTTEHWDVGDMLHFRAPIQLTFKPFPCCGEATAVAQAALELRAEADLTDPPESIDSIAVHVTPFGREILEFDDPTSRDQARFSAPFCVAAALVHGVLGIDQFDETRVQSAPERELMRRTTVVPDESLASHGGAVEVRLRDGSVFTREIKEPKGHYTVGMQEQDVTDKFHGCVDRTLGPDRAGHLLEFLRRPDGRTADWLALLTPSRTSRRTNCRRRRA